MTMFGNDMVGMVVWQLKMLYRADNDSCALIEASAEPAMEKLRGLLEKVNGKRVVDVSVSWHFAIFVYFLSRELYRDSKNKEICSALFLLNKALSGIDLFYEIKFPDVFLICHTVGAVFSKASYSEYCVFHQSVTVGRKGQTRPELGKYLVMYPGSMIIGNCKVGDNTVLAPGVRLIDTDTPGNCYVFEDTSGQVRFREANGIHAERFFK